MGKQYITRKGSFDSMHRVMNECQKCFNIHGHTYLYELTFEFEQMESIGYAVDFKEIKRVACQWIDDMLDHGAILNAKDDVMIDACKQLSSKIWLMSLNGEYHYCNPTAENISKEIFIAIDTIFKLHYPQLILHKVKLYETPNCYTECYDESITVVEKQHWYNKNYEDVKKYAKNKGVVEYDDRKIKC